jgi:hypothetical protein
MKPNDENSKLPTEKRPLRILIISGSNRRQYNCPGKGRVQPGKAPGHFWRDVVLAWRYFRMMINENLLLIPHPGHSKSRTLLLMKHFIKQGEGEKLRKS